MSAQPMPWRSNVDYEESPPPQKYRQPEPIRPLGINCKRANFLWDFPNATTRHSQPGIGESDSLTAIFSLIDNLLSPNADDGDIAATEHAYKSARAVIESAYGRIGSRGELPIPIVTTDDLGGVRLSWQHGNRQVITNFAASGVGASYLYFESPTGHGVEPLRPSVLSSKLRWMINP